jgi:ketosteroid isomerase-like protein
VGVGLLIAVLPWIFISGAPSPPGPGAPVPKVIQEKPVTIAPAPAPPPPAAPQAGKAAGPPVSETPLAPAVLKEQLAEVLRQLREAQLRKDIASYNQVFSSDFPDFAKRRQKTLAVWEAYDYPGLDFELAEVKLLDGDHALAQVTWNLTVREKKTQIAKSESQTYKVWFSKVGGQWRISNLEMVRKSG